MTIRTPEEQDRAKIDEKPIRPRWAIQDNDRLNLPKPLIEAVQEFPTSAGPTNEVLFVDKKPVGIIEAKRSTGDAFRWMKRDIAARFVYEATDAAIRLMDYMDIKYRSRSAFSFRRPETVKGYACLFTADLGSIGLVPATTSEACSNQQRAMIRSWNSNKAPFQAWYLRSERGQKNLLRNKRGGGKRGLGLDEMRNAHVPEVSGEEADEEAMGVVDQIDSHMFVHGSIEEAADAVLSQAAALRQSVLKEVFEGGRHNGRTKEYAFGWRR